jgi:hypothetical protein
VRREMTDTQAERQHRVGCLRPAERLQNAASSLQTPQHRIQHQAAVTAVASAIKATPTRPAIGALMVGDVRAPQGVGTEFREAVSDIDRLGRKAAPPQRRGKSVVSARRVCRAG